MKIRYYIFTFLLLLAACEKTDVNTEPDGSEIKFTLSDVQVDVESKAGPVNRLPDGSAFGVLGYCQAQTAPNDQILNESTGSLPWDQKKTLCRPHLFYNQKVSYSGGVCTYTPVQNWYGPVDYQYSFFAYYPYNDAALDNDDYFTIITNENTLGAPKVKFSIPEISKGVTRTVQYIVSKDTGTGSVTTEQREFNVLDDSKVPDAMVAQSIDVTKAGGTVPLNFLHMLTGLNFQVNNYNAKEDETGAQVPGDPVVIHSLVLAGKFYRSIEINFDSNYGYPDETFDGAYMIVDDEANISVGGLESVSQIGGKTLLLVSNLGDSEGYIGDLTLEITYSFGSSQRKTQSFSRPENFMPAGGTIYTAQLNFIGNSFVLNFIIDNNTQWEDGGDSDITFE